ncbi:MAG: protocatechuate 3,4-dioxygenase [Pseudomonadota bacterium]|nr:protocatechuate 3,4-dioxygenase [Pseudomonadota bacterium]
MHPRRRHIAIALVAAPWVWTGARAQAPTPLRPTPAQTEGPFYPVALPADSDNDLLQNGRLAYAHGQPAWVQGHVTDLEGRPLKGAQIEIWQCDQNGRYHHPRDAGSADPSFQGFGRTRVAADGAWRFRTIRPAPYTGRTPHIHLKVRLGTRELLITQLYVQGDPGNARDLLWRRLDAHGRATLTRPYLSGPDGLRADYAIAVAA